MFGWTDLLGFTVQEDGFEGIKVVWLTWFRRIDEERFTGLDLCSYEICRDEDRNYEIALVNEMKITKYLWLWKLQNTPLSGFRVCNNIYIIYEKYTDLYLILPIIDFNNYIYIIFIHNTFFFQNSYNIINLPSIYPYSIQSIHS